MKKLYLLELSDVFGNQVFLPYSSGVVASYIFNNETIKNSYELSKWFYYRDDAQKITSQIKDPDVIGFSCFVWNWTLNLEIAKSIKEKYPNCLIVFGGQQQPLSNRVGNFFDKHPYVDILVHGEGEETFKEILLKKLDSDEIPVVNGITYNDNNKPISTPARMRLNNIDDNASPYLDGLFDNIIINKSNDEKFSYVAMVESTRGCPYSCAFCEIGEKYYAKVKKNYSKVEDEIDWIVNHKIEYVHDANSNYGLYFDKDISLAKYVRDKKEKFGYPHAFRVTWAKGMADKVIHIAKILEDCKAQKGVTIALQSMSPDVLKAVRRKNIDGGKLNEFIEMYEKQNISSYVELIWGLPEETIQSFVSGVSQIMEDGFHNYLDIHIMESLINTPFNDPEYIKKYKVVTSETQLFFHHRHIDESIPMKDRLHDDTTQFVTSTVSYTQSDWIEGNGFRWLVLFGHYLGPLQFIARFVRNNFDISYKEFYTKLLNYIESEPNSFLGSEIHDVKKNLNLIIQNKRHWGKVISDVANINWSFEEATAIHIMKNYPSFQEQLHSFLKEIIGVTDLVLLNEILLYQKSRMNYTSNMTKQKEYQFKYNIHDVIENDESLKLKSHKLKFKYCEISDEYEWAKTILWFNRRVGDYKVNIDNIDLINT